MSRPESPPQSQWKGCAVCGYPLDAFPNGEWGHVIPDTDHLAVPVPMSQLNFNQRCDFCSDTSVAFVILASSFEIPDSASGSVGPWAACETCADLARRRRWSMMVTRVKQRGDSAARHASRKLLNGVYAALDTHMSDVITVQEWRGRADYPYTP